MTDTHQKKLGATLWSIVGQLRGAMDAGDHFPGFTKLIPRCLILLPFCRPC
jgi:hypothetical protein